MEQSDWSECYNHGTILYYANYVLIIVHMLCMYIIYDNCREYYLQKYALKNTSKLQLYRKSAGGSSLYLQHLLGDYLRDYGKVVDGAEDEDNKGLDNFTAAAKVLSTGHRKGTSYTV